MTFGDVRSQNSNSLNKYLDTNLKGPVSMTKLRLELPETVHEAVKSVQFARAAKDGVKTNLNEILVELIRNSKPVSKAAEAILKRAALKIAEVKSVESV